MSHPDNVFSPTATPSGQEAFLEVHMMHLLHNTHADDCYFELDFKDLIFKIKLLDLGYMVC